MNLELQAASVVKSGRPILDRADIALVPGSFLAICGPNGAGKSTALSLLDGSERPTSGKVTLEGRSLSSIGRGELARRRAVVPQRHLLSFPFLVHEVVAMGRMPHERRSTRHQDEAICREAMALLDIAPLAERNYLTLSGGERQRVMIARALAQVWEPSDEGARYLLLDEPTAALDLKYQIKLMKLLKRLAGEGWAIGAVLHDLGLVRRWCDEVLLMKDGRVAAEGLPADMLTADRLAEIFDLDEPYTVE
ncbi:hemin ABC transporter ATP binding protein [Parvularcula bermudensis HTCC2503]|uniref:Hemin ABC transporter ATP binding protein n=1 Tax=Parvularcula bermudensis (strain ATCC BAA-594 / HTCC2503 / KCTC 12087) TaxID=314260 RepID=E0THI4_PARBH|nr:heme ABC transporter ATP-binding protein [Parvularcula bermudensis]ADM10776.1 hemin ABC transporter ATP binding protein [Parvularcula bermudensis HTCC2503]